MNLIAEVEGRFGASLHIITTHASVVNCIDEKLIIAIPNVVTCFNDLRNQFPNITNTTKDSRFSTDTIEPVFQTASQAFCVRSLLESPDSAVVIHVAENGEADWKPFVGQNKKQFVPYYGGKKFADAYGGVTIAAIYVFMPTLGEQKVYGQSVIFHPDRESGDWRPEIISKDRITHVGQAAIDARKYDAIFTKPSSGLVNIGLS